MNFLPLLNQKFFLIGLTFLLPPVAIYAQDSQSSQLQQQDLFANGDAGYHTCRIPAIAVTNDETLLAFCEGRKNSRSDTGDIDLLIRRSTDKGKTWSPIEVIWDDATNTCGNPCCVLDRETGIVWLLTTWNAGSSQEKGTQTGFGEDSRRVFVTFSEDDGLTWAKPREITADVKEKDWSWYATGPGAGIQIERGSHQGRLVIPCDHNTPSKKPGDRFSHVIYSDDHGKTWRLGGSTLNGTVNECEVVELADERLQLNMRSYDRSQPTRQIALSSDGGATWENQQHDPTLVEPICQASIRRYRWPSDDQPGVILFSNPAHDKRRRHMTVRASLDEGKSWPIARQLYKGPAAYSCLIALPEGRIGCLYEADDKRIVFADFDPEWLVPATATE